MAYIRIPPGLEKAYSDISQIIKYPLLYPHLFDKLNMDCPKGVLLYGPPGVGKTYLVKCLCESFNANLVAISGAEIYSPYPGESERLLREKFELAIQYYKEQDENNKAIRPSILFIDEIDALTPKREISSNSVESRVVAQLLSLMDGFEHKNKGLSIRERQRVMVIGATNHPNLIDPALRRPGRFDREVYIDTPKVEARENILKFCLRELILGKAVDDKVDFSELAHRTVGYVGADLAMLCREATIKALNRSLQFNPTTPLLLTKEDMEYALLKVQPSLTRHESVVPSISTSLNWNSIAGMDEVIHQLKMIVELPMKSPEKFERLGLRRPRGVLLFGPPGCSKTSLVRITASAANLTLFTLNGATVYSSLVGESEAIVRETFERARRASPSLIFIDEMDALVGKRGLDGSTNQSDQVQERILSMLLNEMDGVAEAGAVLVMGATNRPDKLDLALLRPGRLDKKIYVGPPNELARKAILKLYTKNLPLDDNVDLNDFAKRTEGYSGSDIKSLTREAAIIAVREWDLKNDLKNDLDMDSITVDKRHFESALEMVIPSLNQLDLSFYESF